MSDPILSILTPTIPTRRAQACALRDAIKQQAAQVGRPGLIEHRFAEGPPYPNDPKASVGYKRDRLMREARGLYVAFVDDDDNVSGDYVERIVEAALQRPHVVTFEQVATVNGESAKVVFRLGANDDPFVPGHLVISRNAWHVCAWRREIAILSQFPFRNYGEDREWAKPLWGITWLREIHIPKVLHYYNHSSETTAAPPPSS